MRGCKTLKKKRKKEKNKKKLEKKEKVKGQAFQIDNIVSEPV